MKTLTVILLGLSMLACGNLGPIDLDHPANRVSQGTPVAASSDAAPPAITAPTACDVNATSGLVPTTDALPVLHQIHEATFSRPYSCGANGYESSALFLSQRVHAQNAPDLLYNCGVADYLEASTAGDDFSLISDLGPVPLESVDAAKAFNYKRVVGYDNTFREDVDVVRGHTYAVLVAKADHRALFVLNVVAHTPGCAMTIRYAVKQYSFLQTEQESYGFDWSATNK
jgi:hypothetical protein